jgi:anti-anti-sigma factor
MPAQSKVIPLEGEIDLHISPRIATTLNAAVKAKPRNLVIDMGNVSYIDSSGLAVLIEAMQRVEKYGGKFALAGLQQNVLKQPKQSVHERLTALSSRTLFRGRAVRLAGLS